MCCGSSGGSTTNTTVQNNIPPWISQAGQQIYQQAQGIAKQPYQPYPLPRIAGFTPDTEQSFSLTRGIAGQPFNPVPYMNPYWSSIVDRTAQNALRQDDIARASRSANAVAAGGYGGYRHGIEEAEATKNLQDRISDIYLRGGSEAYDRGVSSFFNDQNRMLQGAAALSSQGTQQQQQGQRSLDQLYQDFLAQRDWPKTQLQFVSDQFRANPATSMSYGSTTTAQQPPPSMVGQIGSLGLGAYGLYRLFSGRKGGGPIRRKGIAHYQQGGSVLGSIDDRELERQWRDALARRDVPLMQLLQEERAYRRNPTRRNPPNVVPSPGVPQTAPGIGDIPAIQDMVSPYARAGRGIVDWYNRNIGEPFARAVRTPWVNPHAAQEERYRRETIGRPGMTIGEYLTPGGRQIASQRMLPEDRARFDVAQGERANRGLSSMPVAEGQPSQGIPAIGGQAPLGVPQERPRPRPVTALGRGSAALPTSVQAASATPPPVSADMSQQQQQQITQPIEAAIRNNIDRGESILLTAARWAEAASRPGATAIGSFGSGAIAGIENLRDQRREQRESERWTRQDQREAERLGVSREELQARRLQHQEQMAVNREQIAASRDNARLAAGTAGAAQGTLIHELNRLSSIIEDPASTPQQRAVAERVLGALRPAYGASEGRADIATLQAMRSTYGDAVRASAGDAAEINRLMTQAYGPDWQQRMRGVAGTSTPGPQQPGQPRDPLGVRN